MLIEAIFQALQIVCTVHFDKFVLQPRLAQHVKNMPRFCEVEQRLVAQGQFRQMAGCAERYQIILTDRLQMLNDNSEDYRISICNPAAWYEEVAEDRTQIEYTLRDVYGLGAERSTNLYIEAIGGCSDYLSVLSSTMLCANLTLSYQKEARRALVYYLTLNVS